MTLKYLGLDHVSREQMLDEVKCDETYITEPTTIKERKSIWP